MSNRTGKCKVSKISSKVSLKHSPWLWVPSLYFAEGLPYTIVLLQSVAMYSMLNLSNTEIAFYTGWLYLPWVIKPIWGPLVDVFFRKRVCIVSMQLFIGGAFAAVALLLPTSWQIQGTLALFWLIAFASATHDIAADGMYMLGLDEGNQSFFVGSRSLFYRLAMLFGQGGVFLFVGLLSEHLDVAISWSIAFLFLSALILTLGFYHFKTLPKLEVFKKKRPSPKAILYETFHVFGLFFKRKDICLIVSFIFLYRLGESQLTKLIVPFLINSKEVGGLALSAATSASLYGFVGVFALLIGGILGGFLISKQGLRMWIIPMLLVLNIPDLLYLLLAWTQTDNLFIIGGFISLEQFGYGFGTSAFTMYLIMTSEGKYKTAFYSISTGLMALGMMLPGMAAGYIQEHLGYSLFFAWVFLTTIPGFILAFWARNAIDVNFGKKC